MLKTKWREKRDKISSPFLLRDLAWLSGSSSLGVVAISNTWRRSATTTVSWGKNGFFSGGRMIFERWTRVRVNGSKYGIDKRQKKNSPSLPTYSPSYSTQGFFFLFTFRTTKRTWERGFSSNDVKKFISGTTKLERNEKLKRERESERTAWQKLEEDGMDKSQRGREGRGEEGGGGEWYGQQGDRGMAEVSGQETEEGTTKNEWWS